MPRKKTRVAFLLVILAVVAWVLVTSRPPPPPDWDEPLKVVIYPYNVDDSEQVDDYLRELTSDTFQPVAEFFAEQAARYHLPLEEPFEIVLGTEIDAAPTAPPRSRNLFTRARWGLAVRWWHFRFRDQVNQPDIIVVARYHAPDERPRTMHSIAIAAQRLAVAKLVAAPIYSANNHFILAHEILHTVGASDRYDLTTGQPVFPHGYAEPGLQPLYPQRHAVLMAGHIPVAPDRNRQAFGLAEVVISDYTATEIGWLDKKVGSRR